MGDVLVAFAGALREQRQRGIPRLSPDQIDRIEHTLGVLRDGERAQAREARDAAPSRPSSTQRVSAPPPNVASSTPHAPSPAAAIPSTTSETMQAAPSTSAALRAATAAVVAKTSAVTMATASPSSSEDALPWMVDESDAANALIAPSSAQPAVAPPVVEGPPHLQLRNRILECTRCGLCRTRTMAVPGDGPVPARLMFVGEGPGVQDDAQGLPFVDASGELLGRMIQAMGLRREDVYLSNVLKCATPNKRAPHDEEVAACSAYLREEIALVRPEVVIALGTDATAWFLGAGVKFSSVRGRFHDLDGFRLMPTYHPTYLLHQPTAKKAAWMDLQEVMRALQLPRMR